MEKIPNNVKYLKKFSSEEKLVVSSKHIEAYKIAIDTRKFEIELYWKRTTYFWAFIVTTFAGYGWTLKSKSTSDDNFLALLLSCFGLILSVSWFLANKGSKQWQENWENHIELLEDKITGPLYKISLKRKNSSFFTGPGDYSVSKINQLISIFVAIVWIILIGKSIYNIYKPFLGDIDLWIFTLLFLFILTIIATIVLCCKTIITTTKINKLISAYVFIVCIILTDKLIYNIYELSWNSVEVLSYMLLILTVVAITVLFCKTVSTPDKINYGHTATIRKSKIVS
jgi:hypothetical protein